MFLFLITMLDIHVRNHSVSIPEIEAFPTLIEQAPSLTDGIQLYPGIGILVVHLKVYQMDDEHHYLSQGHMVTQH